VLFLQYACMEDENMLWHILEEEEEKYLDNEMALQLYLFIHLF